MTDWLDALYNSNIWEKKGTKIVSSILFFSVGGAFGYLAFKSYQHQKRFFAEGKRYFSFSFVPISLKQIQSDLLV
jgi:hypothetical protein